MTRTALITGASSGFGLLTSITLARRGWRVLATMRDLSRKDRLVAAAEAAEVLDRIEFLALDVTDGAQLSALAAKIAARPARLDALVNNAGFAMAGFAEDVSDTELRRQFETNFFGAAAVTRVFLPQLRRQGSGHILFVSSISGRMGFPGVSSYVASKFALEGWAETLRLEVKPLGIQVVLVEPGSFETDIWTRNAILSATTEDGSSSNAPRLAKLLQRREAGKLRANPQKVADGIAAILDDPQPRLRHVFGRDAHFGLALKGLLPSKVLEWILTKVSGIEA
jgi:NAD(P)-dependent dehydrogenase (short-subunit alcohol dehydrogenase family)